MPEDVAEQGQDDRLPAPLPGIAMVPKGWCDEVFVPWLEEQGDPARLGTAAAKLDGLIAAQRTLDADTFELMKARRLLELRWGQLLPSARQGARTDLAEPTSARVPKSDRGPSDRDARRFRHMAEHADTVREYIASVTDADELSRAAVLREVSVVDSVAEPVSETIVPNPRRVVVPDREADPAEALRKAAKDVVGPLVQLVKYDQTQEAHIWLGYFLTRRLREATPTWVNAAADLLFRLQAHLPGALDEWMKGGDMANEEE